MLRQNDGASNIVSYDELDRNPNFLNFSLENYAVKTRRSHLTAFLCGLRLNCSDPSLPPRTLVNFSNGRPMRSPGVLLQ